MPISVIDLQTELIRAMTPDQKPKYLNSPEGELYRKSSTLYAIEQARAARNDVDVAVGQRVERPRAHGHASFR